MKYQIALIVFGFAYLALASPIVRVEEKIYKNLEESELTNVLITFRRADTKSAWDRFYSLRLTTRTAILETQHAILKDHADVVQADVTAVLEKVKIAGKKHYVDQLWITNELIVRDIDRETVELLRNHPDVESLVAEQFIQLEATEEGESFDLKDFNNTIQNQWGVVNVQAPAAWARGITGTGIVIGNIDTGARHTHVALAPTYRGNNAGENDNYNWFAPTGNAAVPSDTNGHGTHCIGSHSGTEGIGVAPNSRWIACRGCATASCSTFDLNSCGNFMTCPTNTAGGAAQCARAPQIVNNSWGGAGGSTWFNPILTAWRNAGISGVFAAGNTGNACNTHSSPGDQPLAFAVGATTSTNTLWTSSSVGPGPANAVKPDVAAPGASVASASHLADTGLRTLSGTSMAAPHVAGAVALILQARGGSVVAAHDRLTGTALAHVSGGRTCVARPEGSRPNNHVGHGRIDANAAAADTKSAWDRFYSLRLTTRTAILETQHAILKDHADVVQADVTAVLEKVKIAGKKHYVDQLWITNELIVRDIDRETVELLRNHPDVESLVAEQFIQLEATEEGESFDLKDFNNTIQNQWGVVNVQAPAAWARGITGTGIVIGNIDTGARHTHVALAPTYRGNNAGENHNYNWRAPTGNAAVPSDTNGHGTHCIGTHSGTQGLGVAPNSRWIACRGCTSDTCSTFDLNTCGNFMTCPTNTAGGAAQCARAPQIVNNSWGGASGSTWFNPILTAWRNAGISAVFSAGNTGNACNTHSSPGDQPLAFAVGATTSTNTLWAASSVGPGPANAVKPDVAAPGASVASASHLADTGLRTLSGTSMAAPHVAGAVALILQARGGTVVAAHTRLTSTALAHVSGGRTCVARPEGSRPNNHVGHGRIDANAAA